MRTVSVFVGGSIVALVVEVLLGRLLTPDADQVIARMFTTAPNDPQWNELARQWNHINWIALYLIAPLGGLAAGTFVGLLQKKHVLTVAAFCLLPHFIELLWADHARSWVFSASAVLRFIQIRSLPFVAAIIAADICRRWVGSGPVAPTSVPEEVEAPN